MYSLLVKRKNDVGLSLGVLLELCRNGVSDIPFSSATPPVTIRANVRKIDWGYEDGYNSVCAKVPNSTEPTGEEREIELYPYGSAKLRVTEIPKI